MNLQKLCETPVSKRDLNWEKSLSRAFPESDVFLVQSDPFSGPDGFSYMSLSTEAKGEKLNQEDFFQWCFEAGVGIVLNLKEKKSPDYVFNYGMIWNYILRGSFINDISKVSEENSKEKLYVHEISEGYFPTVVRSNIKEFLSLNKINDVKIALTSYGEGTPYETHWNFGSFEAESAESEKALLEAVSWFVPLDYHLNWSDEIDPKINFINL